MIYSLILGWLFCGLLGGFLIYLKDAQLSWKGRVIEIKVKQIIKCCLWGALTLFLGVILWAFCGFFYLWEEIGLRDKISDIPNFLDKTVYTKKF